MRNFLISMALVVAAAFPGDVQILQSVFVNGADIGGLTRGAALEVLEAEVSVAGEKVVITCGEEAHTYEFRDFGADYDFGAALDEAMEYSHGGGFFGKMRRTLRIRPKEHHIEAEFVYDDDMVAAVAARLCDKLAISAKEPTYAIVHGQFVISDGQAGRKVDARALAQDIAAVLETRAGGEILAVGKEVRPKYTMEDFAAACDLIGSYQTPFNPLLLERTTNLRVASAFLDGQIILPGETFSTSTALRSRTVENGYVKAGQIINGEPDAGVGGGICQISSTLYMAALHAEIPVPQRSNHSLMVGYVAPATDAALAEGYIDLVLENNTKYPILIQSILTNSHHIINIYGHESRPPHRTITFESVMLETRPPAGDKIIEDPFLPPGTSQIVSEGLAGAKYELYKIVTQDGATQRVKINTSNYRPLQRVVKVGASNSANNE